MQGILQIKGPICTAKVISRNWDKLRTVSASDFEGAATELQNMGIGILASADPQKQHVRTVFVKKEPRFVANILYANHDLCTFEKYEERYNQPPSKSISLTVKASLVKQKLVSEKALQ